MNSERDMYIEVVVDDHNAAQKLTQVDAALSKIGPTAQKQASGVAQFEQSVLRATAAGKEAEKQQTSARSLLGDLFEKINQTKAGYTGLASSIEQYKRAADERVTQALARDMDSLAAGMSRANTQSAGSIQMLAGMAQSGREAATALERARRPLDPLARGLSAAGREASASGRLIAGMGQSGRQAAADFERTKRPLDVMAQGMSAAGKEATASGRMIAGMSAAGREAAQPLVNLAEKATLSQRAIGALTGGVARFAAGFTIAGLISMASRAIVDFVKDTFAMAGRVSDMSAKTGLSAEAIQRLEFVAKQAGGTLDNFTDASFRLGVRLSGGSRSVNKAVEELGLNLRSLVKEKPEQQLFIITEALGNIRNEQERNRLGVELFGRSYANIASAVAQHMNDLARDTRVMTNEQIKALDDLADYWNKKWAEMKVTAGGVIAGLLPPSADSPGRQRAAAIDRMSFEERAEFYKHVNAGEDYDEALKPFLRNREQMDRRDSARSGTTGDRVSRYVSGQTAVQQLKEMDAAIAALSKTRRVELEAELALGKAQDDLEDKYGVSISRYLSLQKTHEKEENAATRRTREMQKEIANLESDLAAAGKAGLSFEEIVAKYGDTLQKASVDARVHGLALGQVTEAMLAQKRVQEFHDDFKAITDKFESLPRMPDVSGLGDLEGLTPDASGSIAGRDYMAEFRAAQEEDDRLADAQRESLNNSRTRAQEAEKQKLQDQIDYAQRHGANTKTLYDLDTRMGDLQLQHDRANLRAGFEDKTRGIDKAGDLYKTYTKEYLAQDRALTRDHAAEERKRQLATLTTTELWMRDLSILSGALRAFSQTANGAFGAAIADVAAFADALSQAENIAKTLKNGTWGEKAAAGVQIANNFQAVTEHGSKGSKIAKGAAYGAVQGATIAGPYGAAIGAAAGAIYGFVRSRIVTKDEKEARASYHQWVDEVIAGFDQIASASQKLEADGQDWKKVNISVRDAYAQVGRSGAEAMRDLDRLNQATHTSAKDVADALAVINGKLAEQQQLLDARGKLADAQAQRRKLLADAVARYNIPFAEAGIGFQSQDLAGRAEQLITDFDLLRDSGMDVTKQVTYMKDSTNAWFRDARKAGVEIPNAMRPLLQAMIDMRLLTDENGTAFDSLEGTGVKFGETLTSMFEGVLTKLDELIKSLKEMIAELEAVKVPPPPPQIQAHAPSPDAEITGQSAVQRYHRGGIVETFAHAPRFHTGGVIDQAAHQIDSTDAPASAFRHAPKYHTGGIIGVAEPRLASVVSMAGWTRAHTGLAIGEVPIIAQTGEGILSRKAMTAIGPAGFQTLNRGQVDHFVQERGSLGRPPAPFLGSPDPAQRVNMAGRLDRPSTSPLSARTITPQASPTERSVFNVQSLVDVRRERSSVSQGLFTTRHAIDERNRETNIFTSRDLTRLGDRAGSGIRDQGSRPLSFMAADRQTTADLLPPPREHVSSIALPPAVPPSADRGPGVHVDVGSITIQGGVVAMSEREFAAKTGRHVLRKLKAKGVRFNSRAA